jgi:NAD(P)H-dependent flavin oxidoreductase YrpB (nitropropane dioxygenase family)
VIRTPLTDLLGISCPVVQAAMGYVAGARLAAATSSAGGLGIIASATMSPEALRYAIKEVQARTSAPFGVNLRADAADAAERVELIIAAGVPVASFALAPRPELISRLRDAGVTTIASAGARRHAEKVAAWGIDAVIATGGEGGGHTGSVPTSLLLPQIVDAVDIPVIAAGGFFDGRGLADRRPAVLRGAHRRDHDRRRAAPAPTGRLRQHSSSMIVTFAWPPPSHMVTIPCRPPVRSSA